MKALAFGKRQEEAKEEKLIPGLSWDADIVLNERKSRTMAWRVASAAIVMAMLMAVALIMIMPLHTVVPYVVTVDKLTGESTVAMSAHEHLATSALSDKHWIKTFLIARERYNAYLLQHDYDTVRNLAGDKPWASYNKLFEGDDGLDKKYADKVEIIPTILSITLSAPSTATVRYELSTKNQNAEPQITRRIATMHYSYKQVSKKEFDMIDNPLGFSVDAYQTDPEFINATSDKGSDK